MNKDIKNWIQELKQNQMLNELEKKQVREFSNYFKYSGKIEEFKEVRENSPSYIKNKIDTNDPIVEFYFENIEHTLKEIADIFELAPRTVQTRIQDYFDNNFKNKKNGKDFKNGKCK